MRILVCGSSGCIGSAVVRALRWRGHRVIETARAESAADGEDVVVLDFARAESAADWTARLGGLDLDAVVNCVGTALPGAASDAALRLHATAPIALFRGAAAAGVARVVNVSALACAGRSGDEALGGWSAKREADSALLGLDVDAVVVRPGLVFGPGSRSAAALAAIVRAPALLLPDGGRQPLQPIHVFELAEAIATLVDRTGSARGTYAIGGLTISYRALLTALRRAQGVHETACVALPMSVVAWAAHISAFLGRAAPGADVLRLLATSTEIRRNAAPVLLGRAPSSLAEGLRVTPLPQCAPAPAWVARRRRGYSPQGELS